MRSIHRKDYAMNIIKINAGQTNCKGCQMFVEVSGGPTCLNLIHWHGGTPPQPVCYVADVPGDSLNSDSSEEFSERNI